MVLCQVCASDAANLDWPCVKAEALPLWQKMSGTVDQRQQVDAGIHCNTFTDKLTSYHTLYSATLTYMLDWVHGCEEGRYLKSMCQEEDCEVTVKRVGMLPEGLGMEGLHGILL